MADQNQPDIERYKTQLALELERYKGELQQQLETYKGDLSLHVVQRQVHSRAAVDFALAAIRGVLLINGGAVIAILAFLSNLWTQNDASAKVLAVGLETPIALFVAGAGLGTLTAMLAYFAQRAINEMAPPEGRKAHWTAHLLTALAILSAFGGLAAFAGGGVQAVDAFTAIPTGENVC